MSLSPGPAARPSFAPRPRVTSHAGHALGGIWRLAIRPFYTPLHWLTLGGMLALLVTFSFAMAPARAGVDPFIPWVARFYVGFLVPLLAFISAGGAIRDDLQPGAIDYLFTRPIRRPLFIAFRFLAHVGTAQINITVAFAVLAGVAVYRGVPGFGAALPLLLLGQVLTLITFSAFGFFAGLLTSRYVIVGLVYGSVVEVALGNVPTALNRLAMNRHVLSIMQPLLGDAPTGPSAAASFTSFSAPVATGILLLVTSILLGLTALLFNHREFNGNAARDT